MKKVLLLAIALLAVLAFAKVDGMSVREKNVYAKDYYSWEQWCWYETPFGYIKVKKAEFRLEAQVSEVGRLETDLCRSLLR